MHQNFGQLNLLMLISFISSPEQEVLRVSFCDRAVFVVNFLPCARSRGHIFSPIIMKVGQDVCRDEIEFEKWVMSGQKLGH